ncbi:MAG: amino acid adenylation domain-containing protein [Verrucomicrobiales bacterium]
MLGGARDPCRYTPSTCAGDIGVYAGMSNNTYFANNVQGNPALRAAIGELATMMANEKDYLATRTAYKLNLTGPALNVYTACSTSLVAVCHAVESLLAGRCDLALAGGVSATFPHARGYAYEPGGILSPDGHCRPFDEAAGGTVFSNGYGVVALKRLEDAERDGDPIHAVIRGIGINNDGSDKVSFTAPSVGGQAKAIRMAQQMAGFSPESIGYVEAHGTGTALGDPIEVAALTEAFRAGTDRVGFCTLGALKSNIGHLDAAAGIAGLIKATLAVERGEIPGTLHFRRPNPKLGLAQSPFVVTPETRRWDTGSAPRRAGVSSFGVGGTNAHVVLEQAPPRAETVPSTKPMPVVLSARSEAALDAAASRLADFLAANPHTSLADAAFTLACGRDAFEHRLAIAAVSPEDAGGQLRDGTGRRAARAKADRANAPVAFLFPGQGSQSAAMGAALYQSDRDFRDAFDACRDCLAPHLGGDLRTMIDEGSALDEARIAQPALFATEFALAKLWMARGVEPAALIGHSLGEYTAACLAGVMSLEDAARLVAVRARLVQDQPGGAMLAVRQPECELRALLPEGAEIAALNAEKLTVAAGPPDAIEALEARLKAERIVSKRLRSSHAFHSAMVAPAMEPFRRELARVALHEPAIPVISNVTGDWATAEVADPDYWVRHLREPVRFLQGIAHVLADGYALLECGPGNALASLARQHPARDKSLPVVESGTDEGSAVSALGKLWAGGARIDWAKFFANAPRRRIALPTYPFERKRFWSVPTEAALPTTNVVAPADEIAGRSPVEAEEPAAPVDRRAAILADVRAQLAALSGIAENEIAEGAAFLELGFDSLFLTQSALTLAKHFGVKITFGQLMGDLGTAGALADFLEAKLPADRYAAKPSAAPASKSKAPAGAAAAAAAGSVEARLSAVEQTLAKLVGGEPAPGAKQASATRPAIKVSNQHAADQISFGPFKPIQTSKDGGLTGAQESHLRDLVAQYTARTPGSKSYTDMARRQLADPRAVAGFNPLWKEMVYPVVCDRSEGGFIWDVDGNRYVDVTLGFGLSLFGHRPKFVTDAVASQLDRGTEIGPSCPLAAEVAALMCEFSGMDRVSFCNTGSEAVTAALRVSRTVSGRNLIAVFEGAYHGIFDEVLVRPLRANGELRSMPIAPGIAPSMVENVIVLEYGNPESLDILRAHGDDIAAVLVEPVQSRRPALQPREFLHGLRQVTEDCGIALVFDEVVTGFRTCPGGAQEFFGVRADIATYGKVVGGGLPIGVVAGKAKYLDALDGGPWQYGDDSFPEVGVTFFAGTFVRHPLALAAAKAVLEHIKAEGPALQESLNARTEAMVAELNAFCERAGVPLKLSRFASMYFIHAAPELKYASLLFFHMRARGIHIWETRPSFLCTAHTNDDVAAIKRAFEESVRALQVGGFFPGGSGLPAAPPSDQTEGEPASFPLTEMQEELFLVSKMSEDGSRACNESIRIRLRGALDHAALERALGALVARHEALRTRFAADGECQIVAPALPVSLPVVDCGEVDAERRRRAIGSASFDLENGPLFRAELLRFGQSDHELLLAAHHTICDGFSFDLLAGELAALYRGGSALPPAVPYRAFADWHRAQQETEDFGDSAAYWMDRFAEVPEPIRWPSDRPRPAQRSFRAATADAHISPDLAEKVRGFAKANACTPFNVMLAAYAALLHRLTGQDDLVIGIPSAGQPAMGAASLCGHCVNFLPIRVDAGGARSGSDLAKALRGDLANAFDHQAVTLGSLIKRLAIKRDARQPALVSTTFSLEQGVGALDFGSGVRGEAAGNPKEFFGFDLSLFLVEEGGGFRIHTIFNRDLFDAATIGRWLGYYVGMLGAIAAQGGAAIGDLAMMPEAERHLVLRKWNATRVPYPGDKAAHQLFEERAAQHPDSVALMGDGGEVTYAALNARANQIAHALRERGIGGGDRVGIFLERGPDLIAAMFGVLKAGAAYVPVDPCYPAERIAFMLADTGARATLTQSSLADRLPTEAEAMLAAEAAGRAENPNIATSAADVAYIIYTSGSTGQPKGVPVPHRGIVRLVKGANYCDFSRSQVFLQAATVCFDASVFEIYGPLLNGARLALLPPGSPSLETLGEAIRRHGVTTLWLTSGLFQMMVEERIADLRGLKQLLAGGDALSVPHVRKALRELDGTVLINGYGPTENTTFTCCHRITEADAEKPSIPVGRPISNTTAYILDRRGNPVPPGIPGELCTGGDGLARDYLNNPELSAERYAADPFSAEPGARLYRTGDLCRHLPDGTIEFLGRIDHQLKIRGFRVEPGEIESALYANPAVGRCKVVAKGADAGSKFLVGYASPANGVPVTPESLREHLRHRLPDYMVPSSFVILPSLPLTPNGKIDTRSLPEPERAAARDGSATRDGSAEAPATAAERCLARLWEDTLGAEGIGRDEDFFALGGHSLLGLRLFTRIEREFGQALPLATLFQAPTVRKLAALLESAAEGGDVPNILIPVQPDGSGDPLFCVHGGDGGILFYKTLADRLGNDRPFFAVEAPTLTSDAPIPEERVEETAARYVEELLRFRPRGPFLLGGYSFGGLVAYEMAQQLRQAGHDVPFLGLFDTENPAAEVRPYSLMERAAVRWSAQEGDNFFAKVGALSRRAGEGLMNKLRYSTQAAAAAAAAPAKGGSKLRHIQLREAHARAMECYAPQPYAGRVTLCKAAAINDKFEVPDDYGWGDLAGGGLDIIEIPGAHLTIFEEDNAPDLAAAVRRALGGIDASAALASNAAAAAALSVPL